MIKVWLIVSSLLVLAGCANAPKNSSWDDAKEESAGAVPQSSRPKKTVQTSTVQTTTTAKTSIVVDNADLQTLEKMNKAMEAFVLKNQPASFKSLCKDKRFDCFVDDKTFPTGKKKITRTVPAYASGSKMGLVGEKRIQARYDFYP